MNWLVGWVIMYVYTDSYIEAMRFDQYKLNVSYIGICIAIILWYNYAECFFIVYV